ncbi:MAG: hypothetical protein R3194_04065 [Limnobacter sp.]|nr:hypothetical protein [Limnobacter sp.]
MSQVANIAKKALKTVANSIVVFTAIILISMMTTVGTLAYIKLDSNGLLPRSLSLGGFKVESREMPRRQEVLPDKFKFGPKPDHYNA